MHAYVVETGLVTQHWSGKSEGFAQHSQHVEYAIVRGGWGHAPRKFLKLQAQIESEVILENI